MLIIFGGNVLLDGFGQVHRVRLPEWKEEYIAVHDELNTTLHGMGSSYDAISRKIVLFGSGVYSPAR